MQQENIHLHHLKQDQQICTSRFEKKKQIIIPTINCHNNNNNKNNNYNEKNLFAGQATAIMTESPFHPHPRVIHSPYCCWRGRGQVHGFALYRQTLAQKDTLSMVECSLCNPPLNHPHSVVGHPITPSPKHDGEHYCHLLHGKMRKLGIIYGWRGHPSPAQDRGTLIEHFLSQNWYTENLITKPANSLPTTVHRQPRLDLTFSLLELQNLASNHWMSPCTVQNTEQRSIHYMFTI